MSKITTHVLDTARGRPAAGVGVRLEVLAAGEWKELGRAVTNADGRALDLMGSQDGIEKAIYRLTFDTGSYFQSLALKGFYPEVVVQFEVSSPAEHHHVPLLLSPHGYSTYRGS